MIFLTEDDFIQYQVREAVLSVLTISTSTLDGAELAGIEQMSVYLRARFDVAQTCAATGVERNPLIVMYLIDMLLYHLHSNTAGRVIPKGREDRFNAAVTFLTGVNAGNLIPNLPEVESTLPDPLFKFGSDSDYVDPLTGATKSCRYSRRW
jgi:hypothetical protein